MKDEDAPLIEALIAGIGEEPPWQRFVHLLRTSLGADYASITFRPLGQAGPPQPRKGAPSRVVHIASGRESPAPVAQSYRDGLWASDPMPYHALAPGRVYALAELLTASDPAHEAYRRQLLAPSGMNQLRMMRFQSAEGVSGWLTLSRERVDFTIGEEARLAGLAPFLCAALTAYGALEAERMAGAVAGAAIRRLDFAWLTLDATGRVLDSDAEGARLLSEGHILQRGAGGRLSARGAVGRAITGAIAALDAAPHSRPRAIVLSREPWLDMLLVPALAAPRSARPAPALIAYIHADRWSSADRCEQLGQLFDLLPSEARLALALSRGMSIAEAAAELRLTVESARTYSKRIYAKTGARGQADLLRFIHRSVLTIA
ncbi:MAG: helix-turn-helix transcriptional regulator [Sphingomonadales bacterium]|nr:helix-turn-helix transcriptional regulator [Sphingomonadales bacterium]